MGAGVSLRGGLRSPTTRPQTTTRQSPASLVIPSPHLPSPHPPLPRKVDYCLCAGWACVRAANVPVGMKMLGPSQSIPTRDRMQSQSGRPFSTLRSLFLAFESSAAISAVVAGGSSAETTREGRPPTRKRDTNPTMQHRPPICRGGGAGTGAGAGAGGWEAEPPFCAGGRWAWTWTGAAPGPGRGGGGGSRPPAGGGGGGRGVPASG